MIAGNDNLDGAVGADTLVGGQGNDLYAIDNIDDIVTELLDEGQDTIRSSITYSLPNNVENLLLTGASNINASGNSLNNILSGNTGENTLTGGAGDDSYVVDNVNDVVIESADEGTDSISSSVTYALSSTLFYQFDYFRVYSHQ